MSPTLTVDDLAFEVLPSPRRKTVELTVERDGHLTIRAPEGTDDSVLTAFVQEKRFWLYQKIALKNSMRQAVATKEFVSGEGFPYLGRSYRLLLVDDQDVPLKLEAGRFRMPRAETERGREIFIAWYAEHALPWLKNRVRVFASRVGVEPARVEVRDLGFRWGSCGRAGTLNFNWATILLPPAIVEYVVVHELVHLHEDNHTPEFWQRVERVLPDYKQRKQWLAEKGAGYVVV
ncbi:MAG TPA: SprT family zinc-dependent metalloprotease [Myxococcota bacterium]|nr:SprT family zinc-dependent metalloprotease [Myxococcota bacterium]